MVGILAAIVNYLAGFVDYLGVSLEFPVAIEDNSVEIMNNQGESLNNSVEIMNNLGVREDSSVEVKNNLELEHSPV